MVWLLFCLIGFNWVHNRVAGIRNENTRYWAQQYLKLGEWTLDQAIEGAAKMRASNAVHAGESAAASASEGAAKAVSTTTEAVAPKAAAPKAAKGAKKAE